MFARLTVLFLACLVSACGGRASKSEAPAISPKKVQFKREKPQPTFQWKTNGEGSTFNPETIWDAINGAAEIYVSYGFRELKVQEYKCEDLVASLDTFDQAEPINAFGVFSRERPPNGKPIVAGALAIALEPYQCTMIKGQYYVRAQAVKGDLRAKECQDLLNAVASELPGKDELPPELEQLPSKGQVKGSLGYTKKSYLGMADLTNCLHAKYSADKGEAFELFTILKDTEQAWKELTGKWQAAKAGELEALHREIPYRGKAVVVKTSSGIFGIVGKADFQSSLKKLQKAVDSD